MAVTQGTGGGGLPKPVWRTNPKTPPKPAVVRKTSDTTVKKPDLPSWLSNNPLGILEPPSGFVFQVDPRYQYNPKANVYPGGQRITDAILAQPRVPAGFVPLPPETYPGGQRITDAILANQQVSTRTPTSSRRVSWDAPVVRYTTGGPTIGSRFDPGPEQPPAIGREEEQFPYYMPAPAFAIPDTGGGFGFGSSYKGFGYGGGSYSGDYPDWWRRLMSLGTWNIR